MTAVCRAAPTNCQEIKACPWGLLRRTPSASMRRGRRAAEFHLAQRHGERNSSERKQHEGPEDVHIGQVRRLKHDLLADPGEGLTVRLRGRAPLREEILCQLVQRQLVLDV